MSKKPRLARWRIAAIVLLVFASGCSIRQIAMNKLGSALAGGGTSFSSDDDPDLIKAAAPFSLKLMETILAETPRHSELLAAASSGFTQYAYAFIQQEADEIEKSDFAKAQALRQRARAMYLRARMHGLRALDARHEGFANQLLGEPLKTVRLAARKDVPLLYWTAVSWAAAISLSKDNPELIGDLPQVEAMIDRALELDEAYDHGAIHSFLITYEMSRQGGDPPEIRARKHFERALQLSGGQQAGPYVAFAESVCVQKQDRAAFQDSLNRALALDVNAKPEWRLVNLIMQRRARWLLQRQEDLFLGSN